MISNPLERLNRLSPAQRSEFFRLLQQERQRNETSVARRRSDSRGPVPVSFAQRRLIFLDQMFPGVATYNVPVAVRMKGPLNIPFLEQSLNNVLRRHDVLRTTFKIIDGTPVQV